MTLHRLLRIIRRRPFALIGMTLLGAVLALGYTHQQPKTYEASTKLYLATTTDDETGADLVNAGLYASNMVSSVAGLVATPAVLDSVITDLDLTISAADLAKRVTATVPLNTVIVQISARSTNPAEAADLANATAQRLPQVVESISKPSAKGAAPLRLSIIQTAQDPLGAISPRPTINLAAGLMVGVVLGLALAIMLEALRRRVRSVVEVEAAAGLPVIGILPDDDEEIGAADALRVTWASIVAAAGHAPRSVMVASISESSQVPKLGSRLAATVAETERTVIWVDADVLGARASRAMGLDPAPGLADILTGAAALDEAIVPWQDSALSVIPAGNRAEDAGRLFSGVALSAVTDALTEGFETVVIDATGIGNVPELALLGHYTQGVVLVVTPSSTRTTIATAARSLNAAGLRLLGVVVDQVPERDRADFERRFSSDDDIVYDG